MLGCSNTVGLQYEPTRDGTLSTSPPLVIVRAFEDRRSKGASELGVVRGGYGNILKRIYTERPVAEQVADAFRAALSSRGLLAEPGVAAIALEGTITKLDCNHYFQREAHTALDLVLVDLDTDERIFERSYAADETGATGAVGIFASTSRLAAMAERTLQKVINKALADPEFLAIATTRPPGAEPALAPILPDGRSAEERLRALERLLEQGLITEDEYRKKRAEILKAL